MWRKRLKRTRCGRTRGAVPWISKPRTRRRRVPRGLSDYRIVPFQHTTRCHMTPSGTFHLSTSGRTCMSHWWNSQAYKPKGSIPNYSSSNVLLVMSGIFHFGVDIFLDLRLSVRACSHYAVCAARYELRGSMIVFRQGGWRRGTRELSFNMDVEEAACLVLCYSFYTCFLGRTALLGAPRLWPRGWMWTLNEPSMVKTTARRKPRNVNKALIL
jgi:hypothetical protein